MTLRPDQLGPAQGAREADQEQSAATGTSKRYAAAADQLAHIGDGQGCRAAGGDAVLAADALQGLTDGRMLDVERVGWN